MPELADYSVHTKKQLELSLFFQPAIYTSARFCENLDAARLIAYTISPKTTSTTEWIHVLSQGVQHAPGMNSMLKISHGRDIDFLIRTTSDCDISQLVMYAAVCNLINV